MRVAAYIDGYNVYHAVKRRADNHHKWLDLWKICERFIPSQTAKLVEVHYFSAYAHWLPTEQQRHRAYVGALEATGVEAHMARFADKDRKCPSCRHRWKGHEEKETDVRIAVKLLQHGFEDRFDRALIVSRDSDLVPAAAAFKQMFPKKELYVVAPFGAGHSTEMLGVCDGKRKMTRKQLDASLLPASLKHPDGRVIQRPSKYDPPK
ncbi:MAG: NYN domain-containing protein [Hyphomonadaceae bacterium]|nr:NYN domain-containing protein [Hyphomonadaceae bacterium]